MRSIPPTTGASDRRWSALALIVVAQFMVILDVAIVNVALPSIQADLGFTQTSLQWVVSAYAIMFGGVLLLGGRLADLLGRRRLFLLGLAVFSAASLLCGLAWSEASLIAFRALQGLGGALLAPAALSLLMTTFADGRERNKALGIYGAASGSGAAVGVLVGGLLTSYLSWPWIFFINVPVGLAAIALAPVLLRESRAALDHRHFDLAGGHDDHRWADAPRLRADACDDRGMGLRVDARPARRLGRARRRVRGRRDAVGSAPAAAPHLPAAEPRRRQRRDGDRRGRDVLRVLRPLPVPAGRARVLGASERGGVPRLRPHRGRRVERRPGGRLASRHPAHAPHGTRALHRLRGRADPAPRGGPLRVGSPARLRPWRHRAWRSRSSRSRSRASRGSVGPTRASRRGS